MNSADILFFDHYRNEYFTVDVEISNGWIRLIDLKNPGARPQLFPLRDCTLRFRDNYYILSIDKHQYSYLEVPDSNPLHAKLPGMMGIQPKSRNWRRKPALIVTGILFFLVIVYILLTEVFPKVAIKFISVQNEIEMGNQLYNGLQEEIKIDKNASVILQNFADQLHLSKQYPIKVSVAISDDVNAYALPGGHIVVNNAILQELQTPESLVALLSHESTHINRRHSLQNILSSMGSGFVISLFTNAGGSAAKIIVGNADFLVHMNYSRKLEKQADEEGMILMEKNKINPRGMIQLMQRLKDSHDDSSMKVLSFLSSHPLTDERIADAERYSSNHPFVNQESNALLEDYWKQLKFVVKTED
jgi:Zn-dependent protease with chaperone function